MKKLFLKLGATVVATGLMATMTCASVSADGPDGYVTVSVEKFSIGQGYVSEPTRVPFYDSDNGIDIVKRAVGEDKVIVTDSSWGSYISGFSDVNGETHLPDCVAAVVDVTALTGRADENVLAEFDYTSEGGFIFFVNNTSSAVGISDYAPNDGDVISFRFSIYGYGSDVGCDNSGWGGSPSLIGTVDRTEATKLIAEAKEAGVDVADEMAVVADLDSTQEEIDAVSESIKAKLSPADEPTDEQTPIDDKPANTGFAVCMVSPALLGVCAIVSKKRR